jgi:hypothetical protein
MVCRQPPYPRRFSPEVVALSTTAGSYLCREPHQADNAYALTLLFNNFDRDPRIGPLYAGYLSSLKAAGGELFVHFTDASRYTKWGRWGALEYIAQPRAAAPKFDAIQTFIEQNPVWWTQ